MSDPPARELTPDEIVADIEAMKPRKHKVTIYQSWPRMILERERARRGSEAGLDALKSLLERWLYVGSMTRPDIDVLLADTNKALGDPFP